MTEGQFWLALFVGMVAATALVAALLGPSRERLGCLGVPVAASAAMTVYVILFDRDPQAPIFLMLFYGLAAISGALGVLVARTLQRLAK